MEKFKTLDYTLLYKNTGIGAYNENLVKTLRKIYENDIKIYRCQSKLELVTNVVICLFCNIFKNARIIFPDERFTKFGWMFKKSIFIVHDLRRARYLGYIAKRNSIVSVSKSTAERVTELTCVRSDIWPNVISIDHLQLTRSPKVKYDLVYIGSFERRKNVEELIQFTEGKKLKLCIACSGCYGSRCGLELRDLIINSKYVTMYVDLDDIKKTEILYSSKAYISNSVYEGFGRGVAEAILHGRNVYLRTTPENLANFGELVMYYSNLEEINLRSLESRSDTIDHFKLEEFAQSLTIKRLEEAILKTI